MTKSLSFLENFEQSKLPWFIIDGRFQVASDTAPQNTDFAGDLLGLIDKGKVSELELGHLRTRRVQGQAIQRPPKGLSEEVVASYKTQIADYEESARMSAIRQEGRSLQHCELEQLLTGMKPAEGYVGYKGKVIGLTRQPGGNIPFRNERYRSAVVCSTDKVKALHEQALRKQLRSLRRSAYEGKILSSLSVRQNGRSLDGSLTLEPFAMRTPEGVFAFDACNADYRFTVSEDVMSFTEIPSIVKPKPYLHPFVFEDTNNICFDGPSRWAKEGITPNTTLLTTDAAYKIAFVAAETARMLRGTYTESTNPANSLHNMNRLATEESAIRRGLVIYGK